MGAKCCGEGRKPGDREGGFQLDDGRGEGPEPGSAADIRRPSAVALAEAREQKKGGAADANHADPKAKAEEEEKLRQKTQAMLLSADSKGTLGNALPDKANPPKPEAKAEVAAAASSPPKPDAAKAEAGAAQAAPSPKPDAKAEEAKKKSEEEEQLRLKTQAMLLKAEGNGSIGDALPKKADKAEAKE